MRKFMAVGIVALLWAGSASALPCAEFTDVEDTSPFCPSVVWIKNRSITLGCTATLYCPNDYVTRLQMAAFLQRLGDSMFPLTCATGQVMKWNGTAWVCSNDEAGVSGGGTVTSVMAGTGLQGSPNPIVTAGSINIAPGYQLPQGCTNGQVAKSNGSGGWTCQPDANAGGTVTSVATGSGLTGGPITATGTIGLATTQLLPTTACANGQVPKWNGTAWACGTDLNTPSGGTVTSVGTGAGLTGGPITGSGTINLAASQLLPTTTCANNQVVKWNGTAWACANDIDTDTNSGGTVTSVGTGTGLTGGPVTGTGTIALAAGYQLPQSCSNGQVPKSNGSGGWTCQSDAVGGSGTVTSVATSAGLTGGPITATGTIGLATTQLLPTTECAANQVVKWNGTAWACANDADTNSGGTVTSVGTGTGLTGGPVTGTGTIALATSYQLPQSCSNGQVPKSNGSGGWTCQSDAVGGSGTVTSVATSAGLTGGPITATGTIGLATTQLLPTTECAANQVVKWNGTSWACANDNDTDTNSGGTVTSVATGAGLTGGPITATGTIALATGYQLPQGCSNGQVAKSNGAGGWTCQADAGGAGTVTSVDTGTGLTGGPVTSSGTIALAAGYQLPQSCSNGQVPKSNGAGGWTCQADAVGGSGTVTSVGTGAGLTGGPVTTTGTIALATTQLLPTTACANNQVAKWIGGAWTCANDSDTNSGGTVTSVATGAGLTGGPITTTGTLGIDTMYVQRRVASTCAAGSSIRAIAEDGTVTCETDDGGAANAFVQNGNAFGAVAVLGTSDNFALELHVNNARIVSYDPVAVSPNIIAGHPLNNVTSGVRGATISGGGNAPGSDPDFNSEGPNRVTDIYGTVGGGYNNRAGNDGGDLTGAAFATVGGGFGNVAAGFVSTVGGGDFNTAGGAWSTIAGGINSNAGGNSASVGGGAGNIAGGAWATVAGGGSNVANGNFATVAGGANNLASGSFSAAGGRRAKTQTSGGVVHDGAYVWADSSDFDFFSSANDEYAVRAVGGMRVVLAVDGTGAPTWTCAVTSGGSWGCSSDRNQKQNLLKLDGRDVLARLVGMPVYQWNPKGVNEHLRHFGPTAQDFHATFGLGDSPLRIGQQDADGVAFAAIQGLDAKLEERQAALLLQMQLKDAEIRELRREVAELRLAQDTEIAELRRSVEILMGRTAANKAMAVAR